MKEEINERRICTIVPLKLKGFNGQNKGAFLDLRFRLSHMRSSKIIQNELSKVAPYSDIDAIRAFLGGDQRAFRLLYNKHYKYVFDYASKRLNFNKELANEISSQTFVNFYRYASRYNTDYNVKVSSFLCEIANNLIIDNYRRQQRTVECNSFSLSAGNINNEELNISNCSTTAPDHLLDKKLSYNILYSQIDKLDAVSNKIIRYFYKDELSYQEICDKLELPLHLVKTKLFRAKKKLRTLLKDSGVR